MDIKEPAVLVCYRILSLSAAPAQIFAQFKTGDTHR